MTHETPHRGRKLGFILIIIIMLLTMLASIFANNIIHSKRVEAIFDEYYEQMDSLHNE